jgi:hypothetical protein
MTPTFEHPRKRLLQWFTDEQIREYYGAFSYDELDAVANRMQDMSSDSKRKYKLQLSKLAGEGK